MTAFAAWGIQFRNTIGRLDDLIHLSPTPDGINPPQGLGTFHVRACAMNLLTAPSMTSNCASQYRTRFRCRAELHQSFYIKLRFVDVLSQRDCLSKCKMRMAACSAP